MSEIPCTKICSGGSCRRISRRGVTYRCAQALADELGLKRGAVYQSLHRYGNAEHCGVPKGPTPGIGQANHRKAVKFGPHHWPSVTAMARDLGVDRCWLGKRLRSNHQSVLADVMRWARKQDL